MSRFNTGNPLGSDALKDLSDNAKNEDLRINSTALTFTDRFGVERHTATGQQVQFDDAQSARDTEFNGDQSSRKTRFENLIANSGFQIVDSFEQGATITERNQALRVEADGRLYRWAGDLPKTVAAGSSPETTGGAQVGAWLEVSDLTLRQDLANPDKGAAMVARGVVAVDSIADLLALPEGQRKEGLRYLVASYHGGWGVEVPYIGPKGGGEFFWDGSMPQSTHNGGTVISAAAEFPVSWISVSQQQSWFSAGGSGTGCWVRRENQITGVSEFGAVGDGATYDRTALQAAINYSANGKTLDFGSGDYELGAISSAEKWALFCDSPSGTRWVGNHAILKTTTTKIKDSTVSIRNPNGFTADGIFFTNPGFDISATTGGGENRVGTYGYYFWADSTYSDENPCGDIYVRGGAYDQIGFVSISSEPSIMGGTDVSPNSIKNVEIHGICERLYYGVTSVSQAENLRVNMSCVDVRRGAITYSQKRAVFDYNLRCTAGFLGSNAFIELACEGETLTTNGTTFNGNVEDIDVRLRVSGVEAHEGLVTFYHIGDQPAGRINNVKARVTCDNLTTVGRAPELAAVRVSIFKFYHTLLNGTNLSPTTRAIDNMDIDCAVYGSISGGSYHVLSAPDTKRVATIGEGVFRNASSYATRALWQWFEVRRGWQNMLFTPVIFGATVPGTATYTVQKGSAVVLDGFCHFDIQIAWSSHSGTGSIKVGSLPMVARSPGGDAPELIVTVFAFGATQLANINFGMITGDNLTITPYGVDAGFLTVPQLPASGTMLIKGSYPLY